MYFENPRKISKLVTATICNSTGIIENYQFVYLKIFSTTVALIKTIDSWKDDIDKGKKVVFVFLDLGKAFDVIEHHKLITKLEYCGIRENCLEWFKSYLSQRSQFVSYNDINSNRNITSHGVPQCSVLGPTLFNIHINRIRPVKSVK